MEAPRPPRCDADEILAQVVAVLAEIADSLAADSDENRVRANTRASMRAQHEALLRGQHLSYFFASWLAERADAATPDASVKAAYEAASAIDEDSSLRRDLREYVTAYCDGTMSDDEWFQRLKKPRRPDSRRRPTKSERRPSGSLTVNTAEAALRAMLAESDLRQGEFNTIRVAALPAIWSVFKAFIERPVFGDRDEVVAGDDFLFESDADGVELVRQFSIEDADGDHDRMEQLHLTLRFAADEQPLPPGKPLWGTVAAGWTAEVEQSEPFAVARTRNLVRTEIFQERI
jgi:hypothetical protein